MPAPAEVLAAALLAAVVWCLIGLPLARRVAGNDVPALGLAPALGWAVFNAASLPVLTLIGLSRASVAGLMGSAALAGLFALRRPAFAARLPVAKLPAWAVLLAAVVATLPAIAILPKPVADGVLLSPPVFDHSKAAMVDQMLRAGLPPGNPFLGGDEIPHRLAYYYLWHFSAAEMGALLGLGGWAADAAMTGFTAFASLMLMMAIGVWLAGRPSAALWVGLLSLPASARPVPGALFGTERFEEWVDPDSILNGWLNQASWVPQHLASACCALLAALLVARVAVTGDRLAVALLALVAAAGFESSAWIGGVAFAPAVLLMGAVLLARLRDRGRVLARFAVAGAMAAVLVSPFLRDEARATALRGSGAPIAFAPYPVLGPAVPDGARRVLDPPAFWLLLLPLDFPAIAPLGALALAGFARRGDERVRALACLAVACLTVAWLLRSTIDNNDLGWRAVLPAVLILTAAAAARLSVLMATPKRLAVGAALAAAALGLPYAAIMLRENLAGVPALAAPELAQAPALWQAVRQVAGPNERIGNNPDALSDATPWPVNIGWALMSDRPSCFSGWETAFAYVPLSRPRLGVISDRLIRVFAGKAEPGDVALLARSYDCRVIVLTAADEAWRGDPFAASPDYRLASEQAGAWRIYRRIETANVEGDSQ